MIDTSGLMFPKGQPRVVDRIAQKAALAKQERECRAAVDRKVPLSPIQCAGCGRVFQPVKTASTRPRNTFCSRQCSMRTVGLRGLKIRPACPVCGGRVLSGCLSCCSRACADKHKRTLRPAACIGCNKVFRPRSRRSQYCSMACRRHAVTAKRLTFTCAGCGTECTRTNVDAKSRRRFCSKACQHAFISGNEHWAFRGDADPNRGAGWHRIAAGIRLRDGHCCRRCGQTQEENGRKLDVDHIRPWRSFFDKTVANHPSNLVSLCRKCHNSKTHSAERDWLKGDRMAMLKYEKAINLPPLFAEATRCTSRAD